MSTEDMPTGGPTIADLINHSGLKASDITRQAAKVGLIILPANIFWLSKGNLKEYPKAETMEALAAGLGVSYETVESAVRKSLGRPRVWRPDGDQATVITEDDLTPSELDTHRRVIRKVARGKR